ncbi:MAG TPA: ATP-binding protein, partial [Noviherbaspirillum sp.]
GNLTGVERTVRGLLQVDKSIYGIELLDANRKIILHVTDEALHTDALQAFETPIRKERVQVNTFGEHDEAPHISARVDGATMLQSGQAVGYVRVTMSPASLLANKHKRILIGSAIAAVALFVSILLGLYLALDLTKPLAATIAALRHIRSGNYAVQLDVTAGGEIGELQATIVAMSESLSQFKQELESKVIARTRALEQARDEAVKSDAEKRRLIQKVNSAVEEERQNIAVDIHDHLNSSLIIARLESQRILDLVTKHPGSPAAEEIKARAQAVIKLTLDLYELARGIVKRLRPEIIDTLGLRDAVEEMVRYFDKVHPKCRFEFQAEGDFSHLEGDLAISAYRLIQEALSNVVKHSSATTAFVGLHLQEDHQTLHILVRDNGRGFDPKAIAPGIGLIGMRERVYGLDGKLEVDTMIDAGTTITIDLPIHQDAPARGEDRHA